MAKQSALERNYEKALQAARHDPFNYSDDTLYWLMRGIGHRRFGSECKHEETRNGHCVKCLRKVVTTLGLGSEGGTDATQ